MDHELTKKIRAWLETPEEQRDLEEGALLVLRLSNNRIMYQGFQRNLKRSAKMIAYQLQKYYNFRVQDLTHQEVAEMAAEVQKIVEKDNLQAIPPLAKSSESVGESPSPELIAAIKKGKRVDHDSLPEDIQALYIENLNILQRMRNLHAKLELLSVENATCPDSERYPFLKELIALDKQYHENWHTYDHFKVGSPTQPEQGCGGESGSTTRPDGDGVASQCEVVAERDEAASTPVQDSADKSAETRPASEPALTEEQPAAIPAKVSKAKKATTTKRSTKKAKAE